MVQLVKHPTLDLGSGHALMVPETEPHLRLCADNVEPAWDSLSSSLSAFPLLSLSLPKYINKNIFKKIWGTWVAQLVKHLTLAQVMISWFMSSSPVSGSGMSAQSLDPASDSMSSCLSAPPSLTL